MLVDGTLVVMVPSWFLSKTVKASLKVASSSAVSDCRILVRSASENVVMVKKKSAVDKNNQNKHEIHCISLSLSHWVVFFFI